MNKFLLYINEVLESLDIPARNTNSLPKTTKKSIRSHSKSIRLEDK